MKPHWGKLILHEPRAAPLGRSAQALIETSNSSVSQREEASSAPADERLTRSQELSQL